MILYWSYLQFWLLGWLSPSQLTERNQIVVEANAAFQKKQYKTASISYEKILKIGKFHDTYLTLNLAHAYFQQKQFIKAKTNYLLASRSRNKLLASSAKNQLGVLALMESDSLSAEQFFKEAVSTQPNNETARFNFELVHRKRNNTPASTNQAPQKTPEQEISEPQEIIKSTKKEQILASLQKFNLDEEKARQILDAMKAGEIRYLQQRPHIAIKQVPTKETW